jgi:hypothetical protein
MFWWVHLQRIQQRSHDQGEGCSCCSALAAAVPVQLPQGLAHQAQRPTAEFDWTMQMR